MPTTELLFYQEADGTAPVIEWLEQLQKENARAFAKCRVRLARLAEMGHELRRPEADYLRDEIYELRSRMGRVNYRVLYFFHARSVAVVSHGFTKEAEVPKREIELAIKRKQAFKASPSEHLYWRHSMIKRTKKTNDGMSILDSLTQKTPEMEALIAEEAENLRIARNIYELRTKSGLSQADLAKRIGTTQSVISRLEDADYEGHSLAMLQRIAAALDRRIEIRWLPLQRKPAFT